MSLATAKQNSGIVGASGSMVFEWGETCDGWTVEQRYKLRMQYAGDSPRDNEVEITSNFVTWESKDGLRYRFYQKKLKNGALDGETRGEARLDGGGKGGKPLLGLRDRRHRPVEHDLPIGFARHLEGHNVVGAAFDAVARCRSRTENGGAIRHQRHARLHLKIR